MKIGRRVTTVAYFVDLVAVVVVEHSWTGLFQATMISVAAVVVDAAAAVVVVVVVAGDDATGQLERPVAAPSRSHLERQRVGADRAAMEEAPMY